MFHVGDASNVNFIRRDALFSTDAGSIGPDDSASESGQRSARSRPHVDGRRTVSITKRKESV
jgi:hypothetical protein